MTDLLKRLAPVGIGLLAVLALAFFWNRDHRVLTDARRGEEAARLAVAGQLAAEQESSRDLRGTLSSLLEQNDLLKQGYEELLHAAPDAKPVAVASLKTAPVRVAAAPRPEPVAQVAEDPNTHPPMPPPCDRPLVPDGTGGFYCPQDAPVPGKKPPECVLANGDATSFRVDEIVLRTDAGNKLISGTAELWRELPGPRSRLVASKFSSTLSSTEVLADKPAPRWGAEVVGLCTRAGCGLGGGVLLPPVSFLGLRWEARADAYAGPALAAGAALGARW